MSNKEQNIDYELIARYLAGEMTADEDVALATWIQASHAIKRVSLGSCPEVLLFLIGDLAVGLLEPSNDHGVEFLYFLRHAGGKITILS